MSIRMIGRSIGSRDVVGSRTVKPLRKVSFRRLFDKLTGEQIDKANALKGSRWGKRPEAPAQRVKTCKCAVVDSCPLCRSVPAMEKAKLTPMEYLAVMPAIHPSDVRHSEHREWLEYNTLDNIIIPTARQDCTGAKWCRRCDTSIHTCTCHKANHKGTPIQVKQFVPISTGQYGHRPVVS